MNPTFIHYFKKVNYKILIYVTLFLSIHEITLAQRHYKPLEWDIIKIGIGYINFNLGTEFRYNISDTYSISGRFELAATNDLMSTKVLFLDSYAYKGKKNRFFGGFGLGYGSRAQVYVDCEGDNCKGRGLLMLVPRFGIDYNYGRILIEGNLASQGRSYLSLGTAFTVGGKFRE
jgi:hypothetical protein